MISIQFIDIFSGLLTFILMISYAMKRNDNSLYEISESKNDKIVVYVLGLIFIILFGLRDYSSRQAGDSWLYAYCYEVLNLNAITANEWVWKDLIQICRNLGLSTSNWFTVISCIYIVPVVLGCRRICPDNSYSLFLAFMCSLVFISNGLNGIRNGAACSLAFWALCFAMTHKNRYDLIKCGVLCLLAYGMHHATIMLILPLIVSLWLVKSIKTSIVIWFVCILISLVFGNSLAFLIAGFSDDERASSYLVAGDSNYGMDKFSDSGFRFDFLIYSAMPIAVGYYFTNVKKIYSDQYRILFETYILSNAIWIIFIRASYSNRFAMLSWFIYPFVLLYPFVNFKWDNQLKYTKITLWLQYLITLILRFK